MSHTEFEVTVNGERHQLSGLSAPATMQAVIEALGLKADRVAVERNGEIAPRARWSALPVDSGDRLEIVHFVGGGSFQVSYSTASSRSRNA